MKNKKTKLMLILLLVIIVAIIILMIMAISKQFSNKVVCTSDATSNGITITQKYVLKYSKEKITNITVNKSYEFDDKEQYESFANVIENTKSNISSMDKKYIDFEVKTKDSGYYTELNADIENATDSDLLALGFSLVCFVYNSLRLNLLCSRDAGISDEDNDCYSNK
jgi:uncharacterized protein (UPF0333 family)